MAIEYGMVETVIQNLKDAGCEAKTVAHFLQLYQEGTIGDQLCILAEHRKALLSKIHSEQSKLDCLDYLIHHIRREAVTKPRKKGV